MLVKCVKTILDAVNFVIPLPVKSKWTLVSNMPSGVVKEAV